MIRSDFHASTRRYGRYVPDGLHITVSVKTGIMEAIGKHLTAHGYTKSREDPTLLNHNTSGIAKPDATKDEEGFDIWPEGLPEEVVVHSEPPS